MIDADSDCDVRACTPDDLAALAAFCIEHAAYERMPLAVPPDAERLRRALFAAAPRLHAWLAWQGARPLGYATASREFSTWNARDYLHMDCLYVRADARGLGIGAALLREVAATARRLGLAELQWQTPDWNAGAIRFYRRHGAVASAKQRFVLALP